MEALACARLMFWCVLFAKTGSPFWETHSSAPVLDVLTVLHGEASLYFFIPRLLPRGEVCLLNVTEFLLKSNPFYGFKPLDLSNLCVCLF